MRPLFASFALAALPMLALSAAPEYAAKAANGMQIPYPTATRTQPVTVNGRTVAVPEGMVYVPAGDAIIGAGAAARTVHLDAFCIARFPVTNAEFKAFLDENPEQRPPKYWHGATCPEGKANHPVVYVSLVQAKAYAGWVSRATGWKVGIPTSEQWEKAARGPQGFAYPWGNAPETSYENGVLTTRYNYNAVTVAAYLRDHPKLTVTYDNPRSTYRGTQTTVDQIASYDVAGNSTRLSVSPNGSVRGWVNHQTYTGFIYTDLFTSLNNAGGNTSAVGSYEAGKSAYGCYDMAGNVWTWCDTLITATNGAERGRMVNEIRGGSWYANGNSCRSTYSGEGREASGAYNTVGFRLAMLPAAKP